MLYDPHGRPIADTAPKRPAGGMAVWPETSDTYTSDESRALTPEEVDGILSDANGGDIERQAKLACEVEEKNWDIAQAVQTRRLALAGLPWSIEPPEGDESGRAAQIAEDAEEMLRAARWDGAGELDTFDEGLRYGLAGALLSGFAVCELVWSRGGADLVGMQEIEPRHFTLRDESGTLLRRPRLVTAAAPYGMELPAGKFAVHWHRARPGARCRGGLIRPLAWLHCFARVNMTDLLTFIERYGMPFLMVKVNREAYTTERGKLKALVQAFGPAGGAVLTENATTELLQAANNTGDVYFRLLEYVGQAVTKVVLGQLATSSEGGGWSKDNAQSEVRQDLLEADARAAEGTVRAEILRPWTMWNYGPDAPVPRLKLESEPPEDRKATADTAAALYNAGLEWDAEEAGERMGMKLTRRAAAEPQPPGVGPAGTPVAPPIAGAAAADDSLEMEADLPARLAEGLGVPEGWLAPVAELLRDIEAKARDANVSDADLAAFAEAAAERLPELFGEMDIEALAEVLETAMGAAVIEGARDGFRRAAEGETMG